MTDKKPIRIAFNSHGLGDCIHAATAMRLYIKSGYDVQIQIEPNKAWIWEAAGVPIYDGEEPLPLHPYYYPDDFFNLSKPDCIQSKIAHLFEVAELPKLGTKEEVWRMICDEQYDASHAVSERARDEVRKFLKDLPPPIVLIHSKGTNWQEKKSIPDATAFAFLVEMLKSFGGSIVTLDWDQRSPTLGSRRVRSICPHWGHMPLEYFGALCEQSDLLIGIDSGPFHLAGWFDIPTLYVSREIPPVRCCLPSPNATYLVPAKDHEHWAARGPEWKFAEYQGSEATVQDIVITAISILEPEAVEVVTMKDLQAVEVPGVYTYRRVGHDERRMELLADGRIGEGAAACERTWKLLPTPVGQSLIIYGDNGGDTCHLAAGDDGVFRGRWLAHERMPIELFPVLSEFTGHPSDKRPDAPVEFYVGIPTYCCFDLLDKCIESILASDWLPHRIYVLDNSGGKYPGHASRRVQVWTPTHNLGAGGSFNFIYPAVSPRPYIQLNDDIEIAPDLLRAMLTCEGGVVVGNGAFAGTAIMIRKEAWDLVGSFDPQFWPAYYEDCDWFYRASLHGIRSTCPKSGGFVNNGPSATKARMTPEDRAVVDNQYSVNTDYYRNKWGGPPHQEVFTVPFNGVSQP